MRVCLVLFLLAVHTYAASLTFTSEGGELKVNGNSFKMKGASWFGFETSNNVVHGLWAQDYHFLLEFLSTNGFNAIRLPFYLELVLNDAEPNSINFWQMNADLVNLTSLEVLDKIIEAAGDLGMVVMLDLHSFQAGTFMQDGLWYDSTHTEDQVLEAFDKLATRYADQWNLFAFDLKNEPWGTTWNTGDLTTDWLLASERMSQHILGTTAGSRLLMFVEGTGSSPACTDACFWGEDLEGVSTAPLDMPTAAQDKKMVYSPHCYGPDVAYQTYFYTSDFPDNMPAIWTEHWGYVANQTGRAVVIGEWGGHVSGTNGVWMEAFVDYLVANNLASTFFWCLNPDSGDTGGLLQYDWATPEQEKLDLLAILQPNPTDLLSLLSA